MVSMSPSSYEPARFRMELAGKRGDFDRLRLALRQFRAQGDPCDQSGTLCAACQVLALIERSLEGIG